MAAVSVLLKLKTFKGFCAMVLKDNEYEVYINGKLFKIIKGHKRFNNFYEKYTDDLHKKGYKMIQSWTNQYEIYVNHNKQECIYLAWRKWLGLLDMNGRKIYYGDYLVTEGGSSCGFYDYKNDRHDYELSIHDHRNYRGDIQFDSLDVCKQYGIRVKRGVFEYLC